MKSLRYIASWVLGVCAILTACQSVDEPVANIPTLITGEATNVRATSVMLNGTIENGKEGQFYFLLSTSADLNDAGTYACEWTNMQYWRSLGDLTPNTTYYYVFCATDGVSEVRGEVKSFTTLGTLRINKVTFTDWDGKQQELSSAYETFGATIVLPSQQTVHNLQTAYNGSSWELPQEFQAGEGAYTVKAYAPYSANGYNAQEYGGYIPVQTYKYNDDNYLFAEAVSDDEGTAVDLNFRHTMARLVFHFTVSPENQADNVEIASLAIGNGERVLPTWAGLLLFENGSLYTWENTSFSEPLRYYNSFALSKEKATDLTLYSLPTSRAGIVPLTLYNSSNGTVSTQLEVDWKAAGTYEYNIVYKDSGLIVSDVRVQEWENGEGGDIPVIDNN